MSEHLKEEEKLKTKLAEKNGKNYPIGRHPVVIRIQYVYSISRHLCSFYYHYMFRSLLDHLQVIFIYQNCKRLHLQCVHNMRVSVKAD
jgi:hypothetical protein